MHQIYQNLKRKRVLWTLVIGLITSNYLFYILTICIQIWTAMNVHGKMTSSLSSIPIYIVANKWAKLDLKRASGWRARMETYKRKQISNRTKENVFIQTSYTILECGISVWRQHFCFIDLSWPIWCRSV